MTRAIWYRHWLEIRGGLLVAAVIVGVFAVLLYPVFVLTSSAALDEARVISGYFAAFGDLLGPFGSERYFPWGAHVWICGLTAYMVGVFLAGSGIRSNSLTPFHPSHLYTLTLPVSRTRLLCTRFAASCAATVALYAAMLVVHVAVLIVMGRELPLVAMAASSALAVGLVLVILAVIGSLQTWDDRVAGLVFVVALVVATLFAWQPTLRYLASQAVPWTALAWIGAITTTALALAALVAQRKDF